MLKLIKHELIATYRNYMTIFVGVLALSILGGLSNLIADEELVSVFAILAFSAFAIGGMVILLIQSIKMYTSDLYSARGYLNLTLPVPTWKLLLSKIIVMILWYIITFIVFCLAFFVFALITTLTYNYIITIQDIVDAIKGIFEYLKLPWDVYVLWIIASFTSLFSTISLVGLAATLVSTGRIRKFKWAVAVVIYFFFSYLITFARHALSKLLKISYDPTTFSGLGNLFSIYGLSAFATDFNAQTWLSICLNLLVGLIAFIATVWLVDNKIEIE